ncbi:uncharacterized protein J3D65DRAFT_672226 [Phyllosticta citribraziliensis]|uniref:Uncharacterized protein n=1 Tax=Phyllosticta citribraziliensis TaxID=989973 RepID=A0ABR1L3M7_9PEZI
MDMDCLCTRKSHTPHGSSLSKEAIIAIVGVVLGVLVPICGLIVKRLLFRNAAKTPAADISVEDRGGGLGYANSVPANAEHGNESNMTIMANTSLRNSNAHNVQWTRPSNYHGISNGGRPPSVDDGPLRGILLDSADGSRSVLDDPNASDVVRPRKPDDQKTLASIGNAKDDKGTANRSICQSRPEANRQSKSSLGLQMDRNPPVVGIASVPASQLPQDVPADSSTNIPDNHTRI